MDDRIARNGASSYWECLVKLCEILNMAVWRYGNLFMCASRLFVAS
jgi:hypothetical protein